MLSFCCPSIPWFSLKRPLCRCSESWTAHVHLPHTSSHYRLQFDTDLLSYSKSVLLFSTYFSFQVSPASALITTSRTPLEVYLKIIFLLPGESIPMRNLTAVEMFSCFLYLIKGRSLTRQTSEKSVSCSIISLSSNKIQISSNRSDRTLTKGHDCLLTLRKFTLSDFNSHRIVQWLSFVDEDLDGFP